MAKYETNLALQQRSIYVDLEQVTTSFFIYKFSMVISQKKKELCDFPHTIL